MIILDIELLFRGIISLSLLNSKREIVNQLGVDILAMCEVTFAQLYKKSCSEESLCSGLSGLDSKQLNSRHLGKKILPGRHGEH